MENFLVVTNSVLVVTEKLVFQVFVEFKPCLKRNGDKNVCLMCYAFNILTLNWDNKNEEYDLLLPESIVEYVIYHLKRIKRNKKLWIKI